MIDQVGSFDIICRRGQVLRRVRDNQPAGIFIGANPRVSPFVS